MSRPRGQRSPHRCGRYIRASDNLLEKATLKRMDARSKDSFEMRKEAFILLMRYLEWLPILQQHKDYGDPKYQGDKKEMMESMRFVIQMAEDLKAELRKEVVERLARGREAERARQEAAAAAPPEPEPEPEQEPEDV